MYLRAVHAEFHIPSLRDFIRKNPLGLFITAIQSPNFPTIQCTHMPWILDLADEQSESELGRLRGHMARANPHSKALIEAMEEAHGTNGRLEQEVSVVFNGPADAYVTPKFYVETKPDTGKVVPTWNYSAVQVYGKARILFDTKADETGAYLQEAVTDLTRHSEENIMSYTGENGRPTAWQVSDAPASFVELLKKAIIGVEIEIDRLEGKYKMSQEMGQKDRQGVVEGFEALGTEAGCKVAQTVRERGAIKDGKTST